MWTPIPVTDLLMHPKNYALQLMLPDTYANRYLCTWMLMCSNLRAGLVLMYQKCSNPL